MHISYGDYNFLGYVAVSSDEFSRFSAMAENQIRRRIQFRRFILDTDSPDNFNLNDPGYWAEQNLRGICEVIDLLYIQANPNSEVAKARRTINSFRNADYSEDYGSPRFERDNSQASASSDPLSEIISTFFTPAQTFRGIN